MTLGRCPLSIFCSRGTLPTFLPLREINQSRMRRRAGKGRPAAAPAAAETARTAAAADTAGSPAASSASLTRGYSSALERNKLEQDGATTSHKCAAVPRRARI